MHYSLTDSEKGILFECLDETTKYNLPSLLPLGKDIDIKRLETAINRFGEIHPSLFMQIHKNDDGTFAKYLNKGPITISLREVEEINNASLVEKFEMFDSPLFRFLLLKNGEDFYLFFDFHHIIADGNAIKIFIDSLWPLYNNEQIEKEDLSSEGCTLREEKLKSSDAYKVAKEYYQKSFSDIEVESLPVEDIQEKDIAYNFIKRPLKTKMSELRPFIKNLGVKTSSYFIYTFMYLLKVTNMDKDALCLSISNGRDKENKNTFGMFVKTFPMYLDFSKYEKVSDSLLALNEEQINNVKHAIYPLSDALRDLGFHSEVLFAYQGDYMFKTIFNNEYRICEQLIEKDGKEKISVEIHRDEDELLFWIEYRSDLYLEDSINHLIDLYDILLKELTRKELLKDVTLLDEKQFNILEEFNNVKDNIDYSKTTIDFFYERVNENPDNLLVVFKDKKYTYHQVNLFSNKIANELLKYNVGKEDKVSVLIPKSEYIVIASLAVSKTGAAYQPLDVTYPKERLNFMVKDASSKVVIADRQFINLIDEYKGPVIYLDELDKLTDESPLAIRPESKDLFIMLYTSGSTGVPKGVQLEFGNISVIAQRHVQHLNLNSESKVAAYASYGFDADMLDLYPTIVAGGTIYVIPEEMRLDLVALGQYFDEVGITDSFLTTQIGRQFVSEIPLKKIKTISVGGEKLVPMMPSYPVSFYNLYGPTEGSIYCTMFKVDKLYHRIPIGHALETYKAYVLDEFGNRVPYNVKGELYIAGPQVARGYLNRDEENKKAFLKNRFDDDPKFERLYKTGDIVRFLKDGVIDFIGRNDGQVKIRGFRVELSEVEAIIRQYEGIKDATVKDFTDPAGVKYIVGYIVSNNVIDIDDLKAFIRANKPPYMVPPYIIQLDKIPLNQNQKVNKKALPLPELKVEEKILPETDLEKAAYDLLKEILGHDNFGVTTDLFEAGLTSISSITFVVKLSKALNKTIKNQDLKDNPTIRELCNFLSDKKEDTHFEIRDKYPITKTQEGIFIECVSRPNETTYNIPLLFKLSSKVDVNKLKEAVSCVLKAHNYLLSTLEMDENGDINALPSKDEPVINIIDIDKLDKASLVRPFKIVGDHLYRVEIYLTKEGNYLFMDFHHILCDGTSELILLRDINEAYLGKEIKPEEHNGFEIALIEKEDREGKAYEKAKEYYLNLLGKIEDVECLLKKDLKTKKESHLGVNEFFSDIDVNIVKAFASKNHLTLNAITNFVFGFVFSKFIFREESLFTTIYNGRNDSRKENTVSMLVKTLPVYIKYSEEDNVLDLLMNTKVQLEESQNNDIYAFSEIANDYGVKSDVMFAYQGEDFAFDVIGNEKAESVILDSESAKSLFSLDIFIVNGQFKLRYEYDESQYNEETVKSFNRTYEKVLKEILLKKVIKDIDLLSDKDKEMYELFNDTYEANPGLTYNQYLERNALTKPDKIAVIGKDRMLTYKELNEEANKVANYLIDNGVRLADKVVMLMPRISLAYVVREGIVKSGGAFVPVDPKYPDDRIEYIILDSGSKILISTSEIIENKRDLIEKTGILAINIDEILKSNKKDNPNVKIPFESLCYMIYTSGSTGKPKGVMIAHKNLANYILDGTNIGTAQYRYCDEATGGQCVACSFASFSFDASLQEESVVISHGYTAVIASEEEIENPLLLAQTLNKYHVNIMFLTPSYISNVLDCEPFVEALRNFKALDMGAEVVPYELVDKLNKLGITCHKVNGYGPTETTITCTYSNIVDEYVTIGKPLANTKLYLLDKAGHILPINAIGDLTIAGDLVGIGYHNLEDKTLERFIETNGLRSYRSGDLARYNSEGNIEFFGRLDNQVKLHGLRIELGEIEKAIISYPGMKRCIVVVKTNPVDGDFLAAYFVNEKMVDKASLTEHISKVLTPYMVPKAMMQLDKMPLTPNGKIDTKKLPEIVVASERKEIIKPRNELEEKICAIFAKALGVKEVGIDDDFFELGGTSLSVSKVAMMALNADLPIAYQDVFDNPTPRELAEKVSGTHVEEAKVEEEKEEVELEALRYNAIEHVDEIKDEYDLGTVLLTGSTGFLGIHIFRELIARKIKTIVLVRSKNIAPIERLKGLLMYYFDRAFDEELNELVTVINGDITDSSLADTLKSYRFNTIINSAACVKHFASDDILERINVNGVKNLISIAISRKARLIQISTLSVAGDNIDHKFPENYLMKESQLDFGQDLSNKYVNSKFKAEKAILEAIDNEGLDGKIIRVGNLMSRQSDGEFQINSVTNGFMRDLKGYKFLEKFPISSLDVTTDFSPIDEVAKTIILLAKTSSKFTVFHSANSHLVQMGDVVDAMNLAGLHIEKVSDEEFFKAMKEMMEDEKKNMLISSLISYASSDNHSHQYIGTNNSFTIKALYRLGYRWPITDFEYLLKAIESLMTLDFFDREDI